MGVTVDTFPKSMISKVSQKLRKTEKWLLATFLLVAQLHTCAGALESSATRVLQRMHVAQSGFRRRMMVAGPFSQMYKLKYEKFHEPKYTTVNEQMFKGSRNQKYYQSVRKNAIDLGIKLKKQCSFCGAEVEYFPGYQPTSCYN